MLVLARKAHETIHIGDQICISIVSIRGRVVRVGIEAPEEVRVIRGELIQVDGDSDTTASPPPRTTTEDSTDHRISTQLAADAFTPPPPISTERVNRVLSLRRHSKAPAPPAVQPLLAWS
jgi:carbon storage regulator